jgi:hypothetical protein
MKSNYGFLAFLAMFILSFFNSGNLHAEAATLLDTEPNPGAVVGPLLQTKWEQSSPYNDLFPAPANSAQLPSTSQVSPGNGRLVTDCATTAVVQIMAFHRYPARGSGQSTIVGPHNFTVPSVNLNVAYDWENMINTYTSAATERQRNAVATLMYHFGLARGAESHLPSALTATFGYDRNIQTQYRRFYTDAEWEALIREQLDAKLPVFYYGNYPTSSSSSDVYHAFVVDGYDNSGRFHCNWGWGGRYNGWYSLNNLNSKATADMYTNEYIYANIRPNTGSTGSHDMGIGALVTARTSAAQNELMTVRFGIFSFGFFPGGQAGAALVDTSGRIAAIIGSSSLPEFRAGSGWSTDALEINCYIPETVRPGQYNLMIATRPNNGEWKLVTKSAVRNNISGTLNFTVTAGEANGGGHGLLLEDFTADKTAVSQNERFVVQATIRNRRADAFPGGQVGAALVDTSGTIVEVIGTNNIGAFNPGQRYTNRTVNCTVPVTVKPGRYQLRIVIRPTGGEWRIATITIDGVPSGMDFVVR